MAPSYLHQLLPVSCLPGRRPLRSSFMLQLHVPQYHLSAAVSHVSCRSLHFLEHSARRRAVCAVCLFLLATAKVIPVSPVISEHHSFLRYRVLRGCFSHSKKIVINIDIDILRQSHDRLRRRKFGRTRAQPTIFVASLPSKPLTGYWDTVNICGNDYDADVQNFVEITLSVYSAVSAGKFFCLDSCSLP